jgi:hypothetical protein
VRVTGRTHVSCVVVCMGCSGESALGAVEEAMAEAEKHGDRSVPLSALVAEARSMIEKAKAEQAERARAAAEKAVAAAAVEAAGGGGGGCRAAAAGGGGDSTQAEGAD